MYRSERDRPVVCFVRKVLVMNEEESPPRLRVAVCISGGVANLSSLRAFRESLDEYLLQSRT